MKNTLKALKFLSMYDIENLRLAFSNDIQNDSLKPLHSKSSTSRRVLFNGLYVLLGLFDVAFFYDPCMLDKKTT